MDLKVLHIYGPGLLSQNQKCDNMDRQFYNTPLFSGVLTGLIVLVMLIAFRVPEPFAAAVGIIAGIVAFFVINDRNDDTGP